MARNMDISCWEGDHLFYASALAVPCIGVWVIGVPILCLFMLLKRRSMLNRVPYRITLGFLYRGYYKTKYYWEFVILFRKVLVIGLSASLV